MRAVRARGEDGFTILEVLVATFILVFVIQATAALMLAAMTQATVSRRATEAAALAQRELEMCRDMPYDDIMSEPAKTETVGSNTYTLERVVTTNDPAPNMKRIRVTVTWSAHGPKTYVVETIYTNVRQ